MGLTVESSDDTTTTTTNVGNGKTDTEQHSIPSVTAPTLSSPNVSVVVNGDQMKSSESDTKKIDLTSLFDDPSYAELQSMIEDMEKLGESFNIHSPSITMFETVAAEAPSTSPKATTSVTPEATASPVVEYTCKDSDVKAVIYSKVNKLKKRESSSHSTGMRSYCMYINI